MYRLVFYYLIFLVFVAIIYAFLGILSFNAISLIVTALIFVIVCYTTNKIFAVIFKVPANIESVYITALILTLIVTPIGNIHDLPIIFWMSVLAMASKYILAINKKHIFNPAAAVVVLTSATQVGAASWWIGTFPMLPFILLGLLIVRKIRRFNLVFYFFVTALTTILLSSILRGSNPLGALRATFSESPILFFAFIMLTEPLTTPPTKTLQGIYGALIGFLFSPQLTFVGFYTTPEIALVIGNVFSYIVSPKQKIILKLSEKFATGRDLMDFVFARPQNFSFTPGQYMEWTLAHQKVDSRGNRRFFTIAASPTEDTIRLGVRFSQNGSSFKRALLDLSNSQTTAAGQLSGDFVLPGDSSKKLVFIAGGIGITPFRSMIKYIIDKNEKRDIVLFYANKTADEIVYKEIFDEAEKKFGLKTIYVLEHLNSETIKQEVPDFSDRAFYLSGPHAMVDAYKLVLKEMKVPSSQIITDYFPGYV